MSVAIPEVIEQLILDGSKVGWYPDRIAAWQRGERIAPITIDAAWTRKCNYACEFCYATLQASQGHTITKEIAFNFFSDCAEIGVKGVSLISDGESSVVPFYAESIKHGAKVGLKIGLGTNGLLLRKPLLERILPHISYLRFNFSGGTREGYARIMGVDPSWYDMVIQNIKDAMAIKNAYGLPVTINMQLVCDPKHGDELIPFAQLATQVRPDYAIIKHCADDIDGGLGVDYSKYEGLHETFRHIESLGANAGVRIVVKWNRIANEGKREYTRCYGPPFIMQLSGNGLIAPCGFLFNEKYKAFHIGNICHTRWRDLWASDRYWEVMQYLASDQFNPQVRCGPNCLQDRTNEFLYRYVNGLTQLPMVSAPVHSEFI